jgi:hypothetical protein
MRIARGVGLVLVSGLAASCGGGQDPRSEPASAAPEATPATEPRTSATVPSALPTETALTQVCGALNAALAGELDMVRSTFDHGPLHALADAATTVDRGVAARLLEAKAAVESDLTDPATPTGALVADLEALTAATAAAIGVTSTDVVPTCDQERP